MVSQRDLFWFFVAVAAFSLAVMASAPKAGAAALECLSSDTEVRAVHGEKAHPYHSRRLPDHHGENCYFVDTRPRHHHKKVTAAPAPKPVAALETYASDSTVVAASITAVELWPIDRDMARHQISPGFEPSMVIITIRMAHVAPYWPEMAAFTVENRRVWWPLEVKRHILALR